MSDADPILEQLEALPTPDVDDWRREHIRSRAHRAMKGRESKWLVVYDRILEPAGLFGVSVVYLFWAFGSVARIYGV